MEIPPKFADLPRREQKRARTQLALLEALVDGLAEKRLDEVAVRDLAAHAQISEATFFNYFPSKEQLLTYFIQVWSLDMQVIARAAFSSEPSALEAIAAIFAATAADTERAPNLMLEIIAHQARMPADLQPPDVERGVRLLRLPHDEDALSMPATGLQGVLPPLIDRAKHAGQLPAALPTGLMLLSLANVFFGVPLIFGRNHPELIAPMYAQQLELLWSGARAQF